MEILATHQNRENIVERNYKIYCLSGRFFRRNKIKINGMYFKGIINIQNKCIIQ